MIIRTVADVSKSNAHRLAEKYKNLGKKSLTVGIHKKDNKSYENGETTAQVGFWQEFGHYARGGGSFVLPKVWIRIFNLIESEKEDLKKQVLIAFQNDDIDCDSRD